jgi:putative transposase
MNLMLINVSTRRFGRAVRLPEGDVPAPPGSGVSKSAASRRFVALSAARLIRNLARRLDQQWPGVAVSILEGLDEILTVVRLKLPKELRRSLACTNIAENTMGTIRRVTRYVKRWRDAGMALRCVAAGMIEADKGFRRLKAHKQLSVLRAALQAHHDRMTIKPVAHVTRAA